MPKTVVPLRFIASNGTGYDSDNGEEISVNSRFVLPNDLTDADAQTIVTATGATNLTFASEPNPCPDQAVGDLRKLVFIRASGNSMSVAVSERSNLIDAATTIKGVLDTAGDEVVCIKLTGEYFPNLNDRLGVNFTVGDVATPHVSTTTSKQLYYAGSISYQADGTTGDTIIRVKSITDVPDAPATQLGTTWSTCVGDFLNITPCGGLGRKKTRDHRRYILGFVVNVGVPGTPIEAVETIELPVVNSDSADILSCGQDAAGLAGMYCIGYRGESNSRFHKLL